MSSMLRVTPKRERLICKLHSKLHLLTDWAPTYINKAGSFPWDKMIRGQTTHSGTPISFPRSAVAWWFAHNRMQFKHTRMLNLQATRNEYYGCILDHLRAHCLVHMCSRGWFITPRFLRSLTISVPHGIPVRRHPILDGAEAFYCRSLTAAKY